MKKKFFFILIVFLFIFFPTFVFAKGLEINYVVPEYDTDQRIVINENLSNSLFSATIGLKNQQLTYKIYITNTDDIKYYITDIKILNSVKSDIKYSYDGIKINDSIDAGEKKILYLNIDSSSNIEELKDDMSLSIQYSKDILNKDIPENPPTGVFNYTIIIVSVASVLLVIRYAVNKKKIFKTFIIILVPIILVSTLKYSYALEDNTLLISGTIEFKNFNRTDGNPSNSSDPNADYDIYLVEINPNGGYLNGVKETIKANYLKNAKIDLSNINRENYKLIGWLKNDVNTSFEDNKFIVQENTKLIANWQDGDLHQLKIDTAGGSYKGNNDIVYEKIKTGKTYTLENPTREGFAFIEWIETSDTNSLNGNVVTINNNDVSVLAKWGILDGKTYNINLNANGGLIDNNSTKTIERKNGDKYNLETPTCVGYIFQGW